MLALCIILALVLLLLMLPLGMEAAYAERVFSLRLRIGPLGLQLFPRKPKPAKPPAEPPPEEAPAEKPARKGGFSLPKLTLEDVLELLRILSRTLSRFFHFLSVDELTAHLVLGARDPYDAILNFGRVNAALGALSPWFHRTFRVREEDVRVGMDASPGAATAFEGRLRFTWQLWELLHTFNCAAFSAARWYLRKRRQEKQEQTAQAAQMIDEKG